MAFYYDEEKRQKDMQKIEASHFSYNNQQAAKVITEFFRKHSDDYKEFRNLEETIKEELERVLDCDFVLKIEPQEDTLICDLVCFLDFGFEQKGLRIEIKTT